MSSKYAPRLSVPEGFNYILKDFTREVLRAQPSNIYQFGALYFEDRVEESRRPPPTPKDTMPTVEDLEGFLTDALARADSEQNGYLHHSRFMSVLRDEVRLQIDERQLLRVMAEVEENDYGMVVFQNTDFVPIAAKVIHEMHHTPPLPDILSTAPVDVILGRCLLRDDFDRMLLEGFQQSDEFKTGALTRAELRRALDLCAVGFTYKEIHILMSVAEEDKNGMVNYHSYLPRCFDCIRNYNTDNLNRSQVPEEELVSAMMDVFTGFDTDQAGTLHCVEIRNLLCTANLGLTRLQIFDLMSEMREDENGFMPYAEFAQKAAPRISEQYVMETAVAHAKYMRTHAAVDLGEQDISGALRLSFGKGDFMRPDVLKILSDDTGLRLSEREISGLMSMVEEDEDGYAVCDQLVDLGYDVLKFMAFQDHLRAKDWKTPPFRAIPGTPRQ